MEVGRVVEIESGDNERCRDQMESQKSVVCRSERTVGRRRVRKVFGGREWPAERPRNGRALNLCRAGNAGNGARHGMKGRFRLPPSLGNAFLETTTDAQSNVGRIHAPTEAMRTVLTLVAGLGRVEADEKSAVLRSIDGEVILISIML